MKKILVAAIVILFAAGCSHPNYKKNAIEFLKTKLAVTSVDTIKFFKPDSIYTNFRDAPEYRVLVKALNHAQASGDSALYEKLTATINNQFKTYKKKLVGWDVSLIYKAKNKKGVLQIDTCRLTFDSRLAKVIDMNGVDL